MATIELGTVPAVPRGSFRDAVDWVRVVVATVARGVVVTLLGLALWAAAPAIIGWHPTTVMTGSMEPRLAPGDVVVSRPVDPSQLRLGQVVLYDDPDQVGELRLHRIHAVRAGNMLVTKGDANPQPDSTPVSRSAVHGVAFIRVPYVGLPILWLRDGEWHRLVLLVLALSVIAWLGTVDGSLRRLAESGQDSGSGPDSDSGADPDSDSGAAVASATGSGDGLEARDEPAPLLAVALPAPLPPVALPAPLTRREHRRRLRAVRRLRRTGTTLAVVLLVVGGGALLPAKALAATFGSTTSNSASSWRATSAVAATALTCTNNADKSVTIGWTYAGPTPTGFDAMTGTTVTASAAGTASSVRITGAGMLNLGTTSTITIRTDLTATWTATSTSSVNVKTTGVFGNVTATCA